MTYELHLIAPGGGSVRDISSLAGQKAVVGQLSADETGLVYYMDRRSGVLYQLNLAAYTVQPTVSFKICDRLSIGAGLMITWGNFDLSRSLLSQATRQGLITGMLDPNITQLTAAIGNGALTGEELAQAQATLQMLQQGKGYLENTMDQSIVSAKLSGNANVAVGVNAGILWDINDHWSLAMSYRSRMNMKVDLIESEEGPGYGAAILAAVGCGVFSSVEEAAKKLVNVIKTEEPDPELVQKYEEKYQKFRKFYPALKGLF